MSLKQTYEEMGGVYRKALHYWMIRLQRVRGDNYIITEDNKLDKIIDNKDLFFTFRNGKDPCLTKTNFGYEV